MLGLFESFVFGGGDRAANGMTPHLTRQSRSRLINAAAYPNIHFHGSIIIILEVGTQTAHHAFDFVDASGPIGLGLFIVIIALIRAGVAVADGVVPLLQIQTLLGQLLFLVLLEEEAMDARRWCFRGTAASGFDIARHFEKSAAVVAACRAGGRVEGVRSLGMRLRHLQKTGITRTLVRRRRRLLLEEMGRVALRLQLHLVKGSRTDLQSKEKKKLL